VLVVLVGLDVHVRLVGPDLFGAVVLAVIGFVFLAGPGYAVYAALQVDTRRES